MSFQFELLKEFSTFCRENGVRCFLQGTLLRAAYENSPFDPQWDQLTVAVTGKGFLKLQRLMSKPDFHKAHPNRALESLLTNDRFPGLYAKYVATDTLYINFRDNPKDFVNKGISITIVILVNHPRTLEQVGVLRQYLSDNPVNQFVVQHSGKLRRKAFQAYLSQRNGVSENSGYYTPQGKTTLFTKGFWKSAEYRPIDGFSFLCPKRYAQLLANNTYYTLDTIHSEFMSYDEFRALCADKGIDLKTIYTARKEHRTQYSQRIALSRRNKRYYNAAFYSTMIRKEISEKIAGCPVRDLENEQYLEVIEQYLDYILEQSKNGITPYISFGVFTDAMKVLIAQNNEVFHRRKVVMKSRLTKIINKIPDSFFQYSPVVEAVCYSEKDELQDAEVLRKELARTLQSLL